MMKVKIFFFLILSVLVIAGGIIARIKTNMPPDIEVTQARKMLKESELERSPEFAKKSYRDASMYYDSAMVEWRNQNKKFILFRDYRKLSELANKSSESSKNAINEARKNISKTEDILETRIKKLGDKIENFDRIFDNFPINKKHRSEIVNCKLLYSEAIHAYKNKNYNICVSRLNSVEIVINDVFSYYYEKLIDYLQECPGWNKKVKHTIIHSKKSKSYAIIIDKLARELFIYKNGEIFKRFTVELGANWVGDKQQHGDKTTPEGFYKIIDKKQNGQTKYYKALLLDYPNEDDKKRFALNRKKGALKKGAKIGNLIEIHGNGGKGIDWTDGCIALKDSDMDVVFKLCPAGTWVTIVGSTKSLEELSISTS